MRDRQTCIGCGKKSPETETNYTLISSQFGWRLTRSTGPDGNIVVEWRCPVCWRDYKKARGGLEGRAPSSSRESVAAEPVTIPKIASAASAASESGSHPPSSAPSPRSSGRPR
jgi:hypothetical protein